MKIIFKKLTFTLAEGTPCIDMCSNVMSQQSDCPLSGGSAQRAKGVRKATFTNVESCHSELVSESAMCKTLKQVQGDMLLKKVAFTLAEVLITLAIIGIVAAITIPGLVTKMNDKVKNTRISTIEKKLKQGTDKLMVLGHINGYNTTEEFVQALSEHMKISTYCSADRIADCFPYDKINVEGETGTVNVPDLKTPEAFGLDGEKYSNPVSFVTGDGTPYIISYKKDCAIDDGNGRANSAACIAGIYDWNGARVPNKFIATTYPDTNYANIDIQFIGNVKKMGDYKIVQVDGNLDPVITSNGKTYKTFKLVDGGGRNYCGTDGNQNCWSANGLNTCSESGNGMGGGDETYCGNNKWAAAVKKCKDLGLELPDKTALQQLYCQVRGGNYNNDPTNCSGSTVNTALNEKLSAENALNGIFWSSSPLGSNSAFYLGLTAGATYSGNVFSALRIVCIGE